MTPNGKCVVMDLVVSVDRRHSGRRSGHHSDIRQTIDDKVLVVKNKQKVLALMNVVAGQWLASIWVPVVQWREHRRS